MTNHKKHSVYLTICCFLMTLPSCFAQDTIKKDSSIVEVTSFKENIKDRYADSDFNYNINDTGGVNLIQGLLRKFFKWLGDVFGFDIDFVDYQTLEYIVYGLLALGAIYLLVKFLLQSPMNAVFKTEEQSIDSFQYVEENISEIHFEKLIKKALKEDNYRLAIRYLYLMSLKNLTLKKIIDWHYDKTNSEYINEIKDDTTKQLFKRISYIYEYVWYGEFTIDNEAYQKHEIVFNHLNKTING